MTRRKNPKHGAEQVGQRIGIGEHRNLLEVRRCALSYKHTGIASVAIACRLTPDSDKALVQDTGRDARFTWGFRVRGLGRPLSWKASANCGPREGAGRNAGAPSTRSDSAPNLASRPSTPVSSTSTGPAQAPIMMQIAAPENHETSEMAIPKNPN